MGNEEPGEETEQTIWAGICLGKINETCNIKSRNDLLSIAIVFREIYRALHANTTALKKYLTSSSLQWKLPPRGLRYCLLWSGAFMLVSKVVFSFQRGKQGAAYSPGTRRIR